MGRHMGKPHLRITAVTGEDKDHWILDEEAAPVVKLIFDFALTAKARSRLQGFWKKSRFMTQRHYMPSRKKKPMPERTVPLGQPVHCRDFGNGRSTQDCTCNFKTYSIVLQAEKADSQ